MTAQLAFLLSTDLTQTIGKRHIASECLLGSFETVDDMSAIGVVNNICKPG